jgi:NADPH:quinone reductase-like Zn-dependent oxidoreductase
MKPPFQLPLLPKSKGAIVAPNGLPSGRNAKNVIPSVPLWGQIIFKIIDAYFKFRIQFLGGVQYENILQKPCKKDLQRIATWVEEGKLKPVVGKTLKLQDIEGVRAIYARMATGKRGIGKVVVEIE